MNRKALLKLDELIEVELPILSGTAGPRVLDVQGLHKQTGLFTYDPNLISTALCSSSITFIDGDKGILKYRGYDIKVLAESYDFITIIYLLLYTSLPSSTQYKEFFAEVHKLSKVSEEVVHIIKAFPCNAHLA
ncbi:citrate/2-methylcitrate synthase [Wolbachia endosymbiont of Pentidionis agamae]|uniref:citrate/2-methylcitrate synthase n=1 Tax=Wolbachia endosymbiont of Pentidionis agamae TaxID=3110435 RepID=UPI002FD61459